MRKFFFLAILVLLTCIFSFPGIAIATVGQPCCNEYTGLRRQKYNIVTNKCDHYVTGIKTGEYDILCNTSSERCREVDANDLGICVFKDSSITPTLTPVPSYSEPGFCTINPNYFDSFGTHEITITNSEIRRGTNYGIVMPDGMLVEAISRTDGKLIFSYLLDATAKGGPISVREYNVGRRLICTGIIKTSNDTKIDPSCNSGQGVNSALGCIPTSNLSKFAAWLLGTVVFIASGISFLLMIIGTFQIMTSSGDPKKKQAGSEVITSALSGLLFIILSIFLLKLIGVDILKIPGFGN